MAKQTELMEQSAAELQLKAAMAKISELRDVINTEKNKGISHAELKLQETFFALWKNGQLVLKKEDAKRLYDSTAEKLRGKNVIYARNHLAALFADIQGDSFFDEAKPKKARVASAEPANSFVDALNAPLADDVGSAA